MKSSKICRVFEFVSCTKHLYYVVQVSDWIVLILEGHWFVSNFNYCWVLPSLTYLAFEKGEQDRIFYSKYFLHNFLRSRSYLELYNRNVMGKNVCIKNLFFFSDFPVNLYLLSCVVTVLVQVKRIEGLLVYGSSSGIVKTSISNSWAQNPPSSLKEMTRFKCKVVLGQCTTLLVILFYAELGSVVFEKVLAGVAADDQTGF